MNATPQRAATWEEYDELRAAWLSRLMFGWLHPEPSMRMGAGPPPEPPEDDE